MFHRLRRNGWDVIDANHGLLLGEGLYLAEMNRLEELLLDFDWDFEQHIIRGGGGKTPQATHFGRVFQEEGWAEEIVTLQTEASFSSGAPNQINTGTTHKIDHRICNANNQMCALEFEWNNKDTFFDRDLSIFTFLHSAHIINLGIVITRGSTLDSNLRRRTEEFFDVNHVTEFEDFDNIRNTYFTDPDGTSHYTFPNSGQKKTIRKLVDNGTNFRTACVNKFLVDKYASTTTSWDQLTTRLERRTEGTCPIICIGIPFSVFD